MQRRRGLALPFVLLVLTLLLIAVGTVAKQGLGTLQQAKIEEFRHQAAYAAEAGVADALEQLVDTPALDGALPEVEMAVGATYQSTIYNNFGVGGGSLFAPNGAEIPEGHSYILAVGTRGTIKRQVGVLVSSSSSSALGVAIGVGGNLTMQGSKRIGGSVKVNGDVDSQGSTRITPQDGSGRLLSSKSITVQGNTTIDDTQDVLARSGINGSINGGYTIDGSDSSLATAPFINDYRLTNSLLPGETGSVLPNPDPAVLLAPGPGLLRFELDGNPATAGSPYQVTSDLDLQGRVFYYPDGLDLSGSVNIIGPGSIVVGNGRELNLSASTTVQDANLIAIGGPDYDDEGAKITFQGSKDISGLVYAHDGIDIQGSFRLTGVLISYDGVKGDLYTQGSTRVTMDSSVLSNVPGFDPWSDGFGGAGAGSSSAIGVVSWERL